MTKESFKNSVRRFLQIGFQIKELNAESKKLRLAIGEIAKELLGRTPTHDDPFIVALEDPGNSATLVTVTAAEDKMNKDFNVLAKTIKTIP